MSRGDAVNKIKEHYKTVFGHDAEIDHVSDLGDGLVSVRFKDPIQTSVYSIENSDGSYFCTTDAKSAVDHLMLKKKGGS